MPESKWEGPSLTVIQLRNDLRRCSREELIARAPVTTTVRQFRGEPVCIAVARQEVGAGVAVLVRGFIPHGGMAQEAGFLKLEGDRWQELPEDVASQLREQIVANTPATIQA